MSKLFAMQCIADKCVVYDAQGQAPHRVGDAFAKLRMSDVTALLEQGLVGFSTHGTYWLTERGRQYLRMECDLEQTGLALLDVLSNPRDRDNPAFASLYEDRLIENEYDLEDEYGAYVLRFRKMTLTWAGEHILDVYNDRR